MAEADPTRVVERKTDPHGAHSWESMFTLESNKVRAEAQVPPHLPGIVIFVHGVNSEGEWFDKAEAALLAGLNTRLGRQDLRPNKYYSDSEITHQVANEGYSPVIRFYWGYRAPDGHEKDFIIPLRDKQGDSIWVKEEEGKWQSPQYWGGRPVPERHQQSAAVMAKMGLPAPRLGCAASD